MPSYSEKLKDPRWQRKRLEVFHRDGFACVWCLDSTKTLHVHHANGYRKIEPWEYDLSELQTLCEPCHTNAHEPAKRMKIYLAGKISHTDWRHSLVRGLRCADQDAAECEDGFANFSMEKSILKRHDYVGPFFVGCDHGCGHQKSSHGCHSNGCSTSISSQTGRKKAFQNCLSNIRNASVVFAWINSLDCYGTLVEIGCAFQLGIPIILCEEESFARTQEIWFAREMAFQNFTSMSAIGGFRFFIQNYEGFQSLYR